MDANEIRAKLRAGGKFFEVHHVVEEFHCLRKIKANVQHVEVRILDMGLEKPGLRYSCKATTSDGRIATGNPESTIEMALSGVHWENLDKTPTLPLKSGPRGV